MHARLFAAIAVLAPLAVLAGGDPAEDVARGLEQLRSHRNYVWETTLTPSPFVAPVSFAPAFPDQDLPAAPRVGKHVPQAISSRSPSTARVHPSDTSGW
jgi:hypothetical protein